MLKQLNIAPPAPALRRAARDGDGLVRAELTPALSKLLRPGACQSMSGGAGCQGVTCREMRDVTNSDQAGPGAGVTDTRSDKDNGPTIFIRFRRGKETLSRHASRFIFSLLVFIIVHL